MNFKAGNRYSILFLHVLRKIRETISYFFYDIRAPLCRIEEINLEQKIIIIHCRGVSAPIKLNFNEIISDAGFLSNFSVKQAAYIGYYYGRYYEELLSDTFDKANQKQIDFPMDSCSEVSNPITLNRFGEVIVSDKVRGAFRAVSPANLIRDNLLLMQFTSVQACFIGILSGTSSAKNPTSKANHPPAVKLTVVK